MGEAEVGAKGESQFETGVRPLCLSLEPPLPEGITTTTTTTTTR